MVMAMDRFVVMPAVLVMTMVVLVMTMVVLVMTMVVLVRMMDPRRSDPRVRSGGSGEHQGDHHRERECDRGHRERPDACSDGIGGSHYPVVIGRQNPRMT
jgi:hypothetical protein